MFRTLSIVVSVALADSVNASTIGPALFLAGGEHPRWSVLEFTLGVVAVFFLGGALLVLGPGRALLALLPHPSRTARYIVETVVGVVMLVGAVVLWTRRRSLSRKASEDRKRREAGGQGGDSEQHGPGGDERSSDDGARPQQRRFATRERARSGSNASKSCSRSRVALGRWSVAHPIRRPLRAARTNRERRGGWFLERHRTRREPRRF